MVLSVRHGVARALAAAAVAAALLRGPAAAQSTPNPKPASKRAGAAPAFQIPQIPYQRYLLPNGLTVILAEDHAVPLVAMTVWYHVGSKNEKPRRTGFAHLFEHVMFQGSEHVANDVHIKVIEEVGGRMNGSTTEDRTNYFEWVPSSELETILWLESDRMGFLLPTLTQAKLDEQRAVVKNERRQGVDNQVFGTGSESVAKAMYPTTNPYSWPVIGSMADLSAASLEDVTNFFRTYYAPNNATLTLVGDFKPARAKALIAKYFGPIKRGSAIVRPAVPPTRLPDERRLVLEDPRAELPQFQISWPIVPDGHRDEAPLSALAWLLTSDRTARLSKLLVYDRQLASNVYAWSGTNENAGQFTVDVQPRPGVDLTEIERLVDSVLTTAKTTPFTAAELKRYKTGVRVNSVMNLDQAINRAETLASGQVYFGNPLHYVTSTRAALAVTSAAVQRVARQYLTPGRVVLSMVPAGQAQLASRPDRPSTNVTPTPEK
jgi:zinc protease